MSKLPLLHSLDVFDPSSTKKLLKKESFPPIDLNVGRLCNIVSQIWSSRDTSTYDIDTKKHKTFINESKKCWTYRKESEVISGDPNFLKPTESSQAKIKSMEATEEKHRPVNRSRIKESTQRIATSTEPANFESLLRILEKPPIDRTKADVRLGYKILKVYSAFSDLSEFVLTQIVNVANLAKYEPESIVFRQREQGTAWYVILEGSVDIYISPPEFIIGSKFSQIDEKKNLEMIMKQSKKVANLSKGFGFGELAMVNDAPRAASVITTCPTTLLKLEKRDYVRILKAIHDQEIRLKLSFLKKLSIISEDATLRSLASAMEIKSVPPNTVILAEGAPVHFLYIIKSGKCKATKTWKDHEPLELKLGILEELDYFGEDYLLHLFKEDSSKSSLIWPSKITVKSLDKPVTFGLLSVHDALKTLPRNTPLSIISSIASNHLELKKLYQTTIERKKFTVEKSKFLDSLYKEIYHDPRVNRKNLHLFKHY